MSKGLVLRIRGKERSKDPGKVSEWYGISPKTCRLRIKMFFYEDEKA